MRRWALYIVGLAGVVVLQVAALEWELPDRWLIFAATLAVVVAVGVTEARKFRSESHGREYRRGYDASITATYTALCGAVADLGYHTTATDPATRSVRFKTASFDVWVPRPSLECEAAVRRIDGGRSEVVLTGEAENRLRPGDRRRAPYAGAVVVFPAGVGVVAQKVLDRVGATVVTHPVIDAALARPAADLPTAQ